MMCTFCNKEIKDPIHLLDKPIIVNENIIELSSNRKLSHSFDYKNSINVSFFFDKHSMKLIASDSENLYLNEEIKIHYCPMCGEKL